MIETLKILNDPESKLRWRTPLQATGYVRATALNSVKGSNNSNTI
jgi:hypothetical protein